MKRFARKCTVCGKLMNEGYCIENGVAYYCSDECMETEMSRAEFDELYADGEGDSYWTEWEDEEDFAYYENGEEI